MNLNNRTYCKCSITKGILWYRMADQTSYLIQAEIRCHVKEELETGESFKIWEDLRRTFDQ